MGSLWQDLRYAVRVLAKSPGFALTVVITLGLGIGLNSAIFSMVSGILLREPPVKNPERIFVVMAENRERGANRNSVSASEFSALRQAHHLFEGIAAASSEDLTLLGEGAPTRVPVALVTPNYFSLLGTVASLGRTLRPDADATKQQAEVVISNELWQKQFSSDPAVIGKTVILAPKAYTIVGVMPADFAYAAIPSAAWIPTSFVTQSLGPIERENRNLTIFARLKDGVSSRQAQTEAATIFQRLADTDPVEKGWAAKLVKLRDSLVGPTRISVILLMGVVTFVLLIACANIAGISLARSTARQNEFAVRFVLGAERPRLIQQMLVESVLLAFVSGGFGLLVCVWGVNLIRRRMNISPEMVWLAGKIQVNGSVLMFTFALAALTVLVFGLIPALQSLRPDLHASLKDGRSVSSGVGRSRARNAIVVGQVVLATVLMVITGAVIQVVITEMHAPLGFDPQQVLTVSLVPAVSRYDTPIKQATFFEETVNRLQALPGVQFVGVTQALPEYFPSRVPFEIKGRPASSAEERPLAAEYIISQQYFNTMSIPLLRGRPFSKDDRANAPPVAIVNQTFAKLFLSQNDSVEKTLIAYGSSGSARDSRQIVGVVGDVIDYVGQNAPVAQIYVPFLQSPASAMTVAIRSSVEPSVLSAAVRRVIWEADKDQPIGEMKTMPQVLEGKGAGDRFLGGLLGLFTGLALSLAAIGIYGIVSYMVIQRTPEIGLRIALGARKGEVFALVVGKGAFLAVVGTSGGLLIALPIIWILSRVSHAPWTSSLVILTTTPVLAIGATLFASYIPARRAMKTDPMVALRYE